MWCTEPPGRAERLPLSPGPLPCGCHRPNSRLQQALLCSSKPKMICRYVLEDATKDSLVLVDELGKGTEVRAGAAIAAAVLEALDAAGCKVCVSPHIKRHESQRCSPSDRCIALSTNASTLHFILRAAHRNETQLGHRTHELTSLCCRASSRRTCTRCWTCSWMHSTWCACAWRPQKTGASFVPPCACCPASAPSKY